MYVKEGEKLLAVKGQLDNRLNKDGYMTFWAQGYKSSHELVSQSVDAGPLMRVISIFLPRGETTDFVIHFEMVDDIASIDLSPSNTLYDTPPP